MTGAKLYCLVTEAHACVNNLPDSNTAGSRRTSDLYVTSPTPQPLHHQVASAVQKNQSKYAVAYLGGPLDDAPSLCLNAKNL